MSVWEKAVLYGKISKYKIHSLIYEAVKTNKMIEQSFLEKPVVIFHYSSWFCILPSAATIARISSSDLLWVERLPADTDPW